MSESAPPAVPTVTILDRIGVALLCAAAGFAALLELFLVPLFSGATLVPITILIAIASNVAFPLLARRLIPAGPSAAATYVAWLVVVIIVYLFPRPEGDVILPGGGGVELVGFCVLLGGGVAGAFAVALSGARPPVKPAPPKTTPPRASTVRR